MEQDTPEQTKENVNKIEVPIIKGLISKSIHNLTYERRMELMDVVKVVGFKSARKQYKTWAKHYKVSERMIYLDFDWIKGNFEPSDMRIIKIDLKIARDQALEKALDLLREANNPRDKAQAINTLIEVAKHYREELEEWGEKDKIADKQDLRVSSPITFNIIEKSVEEIKHGKGDKPDDKPKTEGNATSPGR